MRLFDKNGYVDRPIFDSLNRVWISKPPAILADGVLGAIADLIRYNTVYSVARAGTGHLGASLSIIDMLTCIYYVRFNFDAKNKDDENRDIFVLSKGHAVPALYSTLASKGYFKISELDNLRRLKGLQGHCDISTSGIEANTGSLAMGLSRAAGYALYKKRMKLGGNVIVIVGDGELQEGQVWEALLSAVSHELSNLFIIIDHNKVQTDQYVMDITRYKDLCRTMEAMGFATLQMKVSTPADADAGFYALEALDKENIKPKVFIMDTIKGQGISFMEHTHCLKKDSDRYIWHNKAPDFDEMEAVHSEIFRRIGGVLGQLDVKDTTLPDIEVPKATDEPPVKGKPLVPAFSKALLEAGENEKVVVFDADLEADCGLTAFRKKYPERFLEMGIMEQHMISSAAAFARMGCIPVLNSYTAFLTSRSNEQIYNYASEGGRGLIVGHMSGVIPATPGKSHQAYRDIACMKNIPGIQIYQPATPNDCTNIMKWYFENGELLYLRLAMAPSAVKLADAPEDLPVGHSYELREGNDIIVYGVGPVVLGECILAAQQLDKEGISVEVRNHPWLNTFDRSGLEKIIARGLPILVVEDHAKAGGFGEGLFAALTIEGTRDKKWSALRGAIQGKRQRAKKEHIAVDGFTTTGMRHEALRHFGLDRDSIAKRIRTMV